MDRARDGDAVIIVRPPLIYGPGMSPTSGAGMLFAGLQKPVFPVIGDGRNPVHVAYIDNVVAGILACAKAVERGCEFFFVADAEPWRMGDFLAAIKTALGSSTRLVHVPYRLAYSLSWLLERGTAVTRRDMGLNTELVEALATDAYAVSLDKARAAGYAPPFSTSEGIARTAAAWRTAG